MWIAAIVCAAGVLVEFYAVLFAPLGYQDDKGFHRVSENIDEKPRSLLKKAG